MLSLSVFLWSLWLRPIHVDDAWIGEYAYWFSKMGYVKSEAMRGFMGAEEKLFIYHKLFVAEGAAIIRLVGFNIYTLKAISLFFGLLTIFPLRYLYRKYSADKTSFLLLLAIFLSFFHVMNLFFVYRPEAQLVFLGLLSFVCLDSYFDEPNKTSLLIISALLTAIAIASHLNGVIYTGAGVLLLWFDRKWKEGLFYGILGALGLVLYVFFDVRSFAELQQMGAQFFQWRDVATAEYGWTILYRVISEQGRFLHSPPEIIYSIFLLFFLIRGWTEVKGNGRRLLLYAASLTFCLAEVAHGANTNYLIYAFPFFALLAVLAFEHILREAKHVKLAWSVVLFFLVGSLCYNAGVFSHREKEAAEYRNITQALPVDSYALAPATYAMQSLGRQKVQFLVGYKDKMENGVIESTAEALFAEAAKFANEYIIFALRDLKTFKVSEAKYGSYELMSTQPSSKFKVYQLKQKKE